MHPALLETDHRPWPIPERMWTWRQAWCDLLFAHWPVPRSALKDSVPDDLEIDTFDGSAWIGLVPFRMSGVMRRGLPDIPGVSAFEELNVRTYVTLEGKPGVWFFSLDAASRLAVWSARRFFHLPYFFADMALTDAGDRIHYRSQRHSEGHELFEGYYHPTGAPFLARNGSLEHWLTERYCLYCETPAGIIQRGEVHHRQWPLQPADLEIAGNTLLQPFGINEDTPPHCLHFSRRIDVVIWPLAEVSSMAMAVDPEVTFA